MPAPVEKNKAEKAIVISLQQQDPRIKEDESKSEAEVLAKDDLAAEGFTGVEVGEEGLTRNKKPGEKSKIPDMYIKLSDDKTEAEKGMVTLVVTIDKELLRRIDASLQPDLGSEDINRVEEGLHYITKNEPGELSYVMEN